MTTAHEVEQRVEHSPWMHRAAALGFVAEGVVYGVIGIYALRLALGDGGAFLGATDTPREVKRQPFGDGLLVALAIGLACNAVWRFLHAALAPHPGVQPPLRLARRIGDLGTGLGAAALSVLAFEHLGTRSPEHETWIRRALRSDGGDWLIIAVGIGFICTGVYHLRGAYKASFRKNLDTYQMSPTERRWLIRISRFGIAARAAVLPVIGWILIKVGLHTRASHDAGFGAALREIAGRTWGTALLAVIAAGLLAYALYMVINARYRRIFA